MIRLFVANVAGLCAAAWAFWLGYLDQFIGHGVVLIIATVFAYGLAASFVAMSRIQRAYDDIEVEVAIAKSEHLDVVVKALFVLGVVGTAWGILTAFGSVSVEAMATPEGAREAGGKLLSGVGTAYGSSLVGLSLALWMMVNARIVATTAVIRMSDF